MTSNRWQKKYYKKQKKNNGIVYVKPHCNLTVRLVGDPVQVVRIFAVDDTCILVDSEKIAYQLKEKYPQQVDNISVRYACWCFDRHDNRLKILDMPQSVYQAIGKQSISRKKSISGLEKGCDFSITTNGENGLRVRYTVNYSKDSPLSAVERNIVALQKIDKKRPFDLTKVYTGNSFLDASVKLSKVEAVHEVLGAL